MADAPTLAKRVSIHEDGIAVDGERLPFHVGEHVSIVREHGTVMGVTLTVLCEAVAIEGIPSNGTIDLVDAREPEVIDVEVVDEQPRRWAIGDERGYVVAHLIEGDGLRRIEWAVGRVPNESDKAAVRTWLEERHSHPNLADDLIHDGRICGVPPRAWTRARDEGEHIVVVFETAALMLESYGQAQHADQVEEHTLQWSRADVRFLSGGSLHLTTKTHGHDPKRTYDVSA